MWYQELFTFPLYYMSPFHNIENGQINLGTTIWIIDCVNFEFNFKVLNLVKIHVYGTPEVLIFKFGIEANS